MNAPAARPVALVAGATGLVGRHLVEVLRHLRHPEGGPAYREVVLLVRTPSGLASVDDAPDDAREGGPGASSDGREAPFEGKGALPRIREIVTRYSQLHAPDVSLVADHVFCALGTTMRKAGSNNRFRVVDFDYPLTVARRTREAGARHFSLVSSLGASTSARSFYLRVKGEVEEALSNVGFESVTIVRPSIIGGARGEFRPGEAIGKLVMRMVPGRFRTVHARDIARTMALLALEERPGVRVVSSEEIRRIAGR